LSFFPLSPISTPFELEMAKSAVLFLSVIHHAEYLLKSITMSSLFRITPHPGQDITPAAQQFNGNCTVFFIG
ncbi:MAG: hypothetical protein V3U34_04440, partial [candidate division NC10 bacterium]